VADVERYLPRLSISTVLDVGANVGQSAEVYRAAWPEADLWCVEPVSSTFEALLDHTADDARIHCFRLALGRTDGGVVHVTTGRRSTSNRVVDDEAEAAEEPREPVPMRTGDAFCAEHGIEHVNLCKVDTEGLDLEVVAGFGQMLEAQAIDLLQVEAGLNPTNTAHVDLTRFRDLLEPLGYRLFYLYDQVLGFRGVPHLRRANPAFVSARVVEDNTGM